MKFFGTWRPRSPNIEQIETPVGERCLACGAAIGVDDCGVAMQHMDERPSKLASILRVPAISYRPWHLTCFRKALGIEPAEA